MTPNHASQLVALAIAEVQDHGDAEIQVVTRDDQFVTITATVTPIGNVGFYLPGRTHPVSAKTVLADLIKNYASGALQ